VRALTALSSFGERRAHLGLFTRRVRPYRGDRTSALLPSVPLHIPSGRSALVGHGARWALAPELPQALTVLPTLSRVFELL
jgi:hypothetical protein